MDMIHGYGSNCPLCRLVQDGEVLTRLHNEDAELIVVDCLVCHVPMAVLKVHRSYFEPEEKDMIRTLFRNMLNDLVTAATGDEAADCLTPDELRLFRLLPDWVYDGRINWEIDWEQRQIPDHPHCHLRPFPFPNTNQWEVL